MNMIMGGMNPLGAMGGGEDKAEAGGSAGLTKEEEEARQQALLEAEERRRDKHRKMEAEREKVRKSIRDKYSIEKKDPDPFAALAMGKFDQLNQGDNKEEEGMLGQLPGPIGEGATKAKEAVSGAFEAVKGFLPFGK